MIFNNNSFIKIRILLLLIISLLLFGCKSNVPEQKGSAAYVSSIIQWHKKRIENLKKENGWLNLVGLYWLKQGDNRFGTGLENDIIFPKGKAPGVMGSFILKDGNVTVKIEPGVNVMQNNKPVTEMKMESDLAGNPTVLSFGSLRWFIIKREDKYGVRLRDLDAPLLKKFKDIETYPVNEDWKVEASAEKYNPPKIISIPSIIGTVEKDTIKESLVFQLGGKTVKLDPVEEGDELFIIFADGTNGNETYGAGRFLYSAKPDSNGKVILDFNKAYNPPCAFTRYATCPLPPEQNYLHIKVTAGEKAYGH